MKKTALCLALLGLLALGGQAFALICTIDDVPAATLLLPYFEVDLSGPNGVTTLFSINNASATAVLAHVVVWSDLSVPVLDFNVYLTGYDVQTVNVRDILAGNLPQTASAGQDPGDKISPKGSFSQDINFASCSGQLPPPNLPADFISHLQLSLTGQQQFLGLRIAAVVDRRILFLDAVHRGADLVLVAACLWFDRVGEHRFGKLERREGQRIGFVAERVAGQRVLQLRHGREVACLHLGYSRRSLALQQLERSKAFLQILGFVVNG